MGEDKHRSGVSMGSTMLVLIFGIVTLTTFAVLALVSARADLKLATKSRDMASAYYAADSKGEEILYHVDTQLKELAFEYKSDEYFEQVAALYGEDYEPAERTLTFEETLNERLAIKIILKVNEPNELEKNYEILAWNTVNLLDYVIDESLPVWTGEEIE